MAGMSDLQTVSGLPVRNPRSADLWSRARADYLAGASAPEVCARYGLALSTFRWRASKEGWRRADQPDSPPDAPFAAPPAEAPDDAPLEEAGLRPGETYAGQVELTDTVWLHIQRAIRAGRMVEARGWARIHRDLHAASAQSPSDRAQVEADREKRRADHAANLQRRYAAAGL